MLPGKRVGVSAVMFLASAFVALMVFIPTNITVLAGHRTDPGHRTIHPAVLPTRSAETGSKVAPSGIESSYGSIPLSFEPNVGQADPSVDFISHGANYSLLLAGDQATIDLEQQAITQDPVLSKMAPKTLRKFEASKYFRVSSRFHKAKKALRLQIGLAGANAHAKSEPLDELPGKSNYFVGNDRSKWRTGVPNYRRVRYSAIYPGIDLIYYGNQHQVEFDFLVSPGVNPSSIALNSDSRTKIARSGALEFGTGQDVILLRQPSIYQIERDGTRLPVQGGFAPRRDGTIGIEVAAYDKSKPLIIDPVLAYSTYLGGNNEDFGEDIAVDSSGAAYVAGTTLSTNFPLANNYSSTSNSSGMAFVSKLDPTGSTLLYSTYVGGTGETWGSSIAIDRNQNVYIGGQTFSTDFPIVNGFQTSNNNAVGNGNGFVARIDTTQTGTASLVYSSYLGGGGNSTNQAIGDEVFGVAADANGLTYLTGQTSSDTSVTPFPTTSTAFQTSLASTNGNAFLTVLDTNQSGAASLVYSTYLGGDSAGSDPIGDYALDVAVDTQGDAYLTGRTASDASGPFPVTSGAYQSSLGSPDGSVFVTEISTTQSGAQSLVYSTYFGGSATSLFGDWGEAIALDTAGKVYVTGDASTSDFPTSPGAFSTTNSAEGKAFAAKFDFSQSGSQSLVYSTFLGGTDGPDGENGMGIAVDANGDAFVVGETSSTDFPTTPDALQSTLAAGDWHGFLTQLNPGATGLLYSTYLGGSCTTGLGDGALGVALDSLGNSYITGYTCSSDFPITSRAYQTSLPGSTNAFITKFAFNANPGITASPSPGPNSAGWNNSAVTVTFACVPGAAPIQSCTSPVVVSTEGANQVVTGTAVDTANNTATAGDTVNLDLTPPGLTIVSPANNATVSTPYVIITGTLTDSLSGPGSVVCNSVPAVLTGTNFSCTEQLSSVSNSITVTGFDLAGNFSTTTLNITVSMPAPTSLTVTPASPNMAVGGTQAFTAIDQTGTNRPDATWSVSDSTVASFVSGSPNTLVGNAAGTVTLTATVGSITGQTTVTVLSGSSLAVGTVLWSTPAPAGYTTQKIVQAVPTANGPDLYAIGTDANSDIIVQALKSDGTQLWQTTPNASAYSNMVGLGDNNGGLIIRAQDSSTGTDALTDVNPQTGVQSWQYVTQNFDSLATDAAVGLDGTVYIVENSSSQHADLLDEISGSTGALLGQVQLPTSSDYQYNVDCLDDNTGGAEPGDYGPLVVAPDGSVYLEVESQQLTTSYVCEGANESISTTYHESLSLLRVSPGGGTQTQELNSYSTAGYPYPSNSPGDVIPDGQGSVLAAWGDNNGSTFITDPGSGVTQSFPLGLNADNSLVLGDNKTAFGTDGTNVVSFNVSNLQQNWTYASQGGNLNFVAATSGGGVAINDSQLGVIQLDSNGNPGTPVASLQAAVPLGLGQTIDQDSNLGAWAQINDGQPLALGGIVLPAPLSPYPEDSGDPQNQRGPAPTASITVNFRGHLSQGDNLVFPTAFQMCSQNLGGVQNCTVQKSWVWNVEIAATVSDDGSKWKAKQSAYVQATGNWKDSNGNLFPFSDAGPVPVDDPCHYPSDTRPQCFNVNVLQQTPGKKQVFWLDAPGSSYFHDPSTNPPSEPIDSLNQVQHFTSRVCNRVNICTRVNWFFDLVVDPGTQLDGIRSFADLGPGSIP
jgi:Beta-propeller repeat/Glucodextranase, domain B/Bacterial Ig-like domain (group 2)